MFNQPKIYKMIRGRHPYCFRSGQWAAVVGTVTINGRACYEVLFPDGMKDQWVILDEAADYEFRPYDPLTD